MLLGRKIFSALFSAIFLFTIATCEDGFTFDFPEHANTEAEGNTIEYRKPHEVRAVVGQLFRYSLPKNCTERNTNGFEAKRINKKGLPAWLLFEQNSGVFWGVPLTNDVGALRITTREFLDETICEDITLNVVEESGQKTPCDLNEGTFITFVIRMTFDRDVDAITPKQRVIALKNIAKILGLPNGAFTIKPQLKVDDSNQNSITMARSGSEKMHSAATGSVIETEILCDAPSEADRLIRDLKRTSSDDTISQVLGLPLAGWRIKQIKPTSSIRKRETTIDDYGSGDYDEDYYENYDEDLDGPDDESDRVTIQPTSSTAAISTSSTTTTTTATSTEKPESSTHPHRHHHGEIKPGEESSLNVSAKHERTFQNYSTETSSTPKQPSFESSTTTSTSPRTTENDPLNYDDDYFWGNDNEDDANEDITETVVPYSGIKVTESHIQENSEVPTTEIIAPLGTTKEIVVNDTGRTSFTPAYVSSPTAMTTVREELTTLQIIEDTEPPTINIEETTITNVPTTVSSTPEPVLTFSVSSTSTTTQIPTTAPQYTTTTTPQPIPNVTANAETTMTEYATTDSETTAKSTTVRQIPTTKSTTESIVTENVEPVNRVPIQRNYKPYIENRLQYLSITAGKVFRFVIPKNTFKDAEDGYNLTLQVLDMNEKPIPKNSWLQFNPLRRELYGLALSEDISNWVYIVRAIDKEGDYEQDQLTVQVQQHKLERVINHEFSMILRIEKPQEFPYYVDWSLKVLRALGRIFGTNMSEITVREINFDTVNDLYNFTWSNDSVPTSHCPKHQIEELYKMLTANDRGDPSKELSLILSPSLRVKKITHKDLNVCKQSPPPVTPGKNYPPFLRNPVDQVNATVGELLIFKVKDDTFYDPEDVDPSMLNLTLLTSDFQPIPPTNWLQFDSKNREFYGIPRKTGRTEYWLMCYDSSGLSTKDGLEVVVHSAPKKPYNVEFSMTIEVPFDTFSYNAIMQKKFVERLMELFEENHPRNFYFPPFKQKRDPTFDSTIVLWFNKSLPIDKCPTEEIKRLEGVLHNTDQKSIANRVHRIMGPDFTVSTIKVHHIGYCKANIQTVPKSEVSAAPEETTPPTAEKEVMLTFIVPVIIISVMVFMATLAACVLYRRRRMGKMNVEEDGRQSFGNKGIPVIFQEELDEKPEPGTKAPVILKDEKPPLAPPDYSKSGSIKMDDSEPYQPPPPFTRTQENNKQNRPKPTPTYRKPPPYVPP